MEYVLFIQKLYSCTFIMLGKQSPFYPLGNMGPNPYLIPRLEDWQHKTMRWMLIVLSLPSCWLTVMMGLLSSKPSSPLELTALAAHCTLDPAWK